MGKDSTKNLVGQPIFKQIIKIIPKDRFKMLVSQCESDRYYQVWAIDITYLPMKRGFMYLFAIIDLYSRYVACRSVKQEYVYLNPCETGQELWQGLNDYFRFYNRERSYY